MNLAYNEDVEIQQEEIDALDIRAGVNVQEGGPLRRTTRQLYDPTLPLIDVKGMIKLKLHGNQRSRLGANLMDTGPSGELVRTGAPSPADQQTVGNGGGRASVRAAFAQPLDTEAAASALHPPQNAPQLPLVAHVSPHTAPQTSRHAPFTDTVLM